jgi:hypothetical protein
MSQNPHAEQGTSPPLSRPSKFSPNYIRRVWKLIARDGGPREVRILKTENSGTVAGIFTDPEQVVAAIAPWDTVRSVYLTLNPLKPDMMARENAGRLTRWTQITAQDKDVTHRVWLMVDVDPAVPVKGISATDGERDIALEVRDRIADWLRTEFDFPDPVSGQTGNGGRLLYGINLPNDPPSTDLAKRVLAALSHHWTGPNATIDTSVFNAGRIDKLWGTMAVKGASTPERPHRRSFLDRVPKPIVEVTHDQLEQLAASGAASVPPDSRNGVIVRDPAVGG